MRRGIVTAAKAAVLPLLASLTLAFATTYVALSPSEVLARADGVLHAEVDDVSASVEDGAVWTSVTFDVVEWLSDDPAAGADEEGDEVAPRESVTLAFLGGEAEGRRLLVAGSPTWRPGDEVLLAFDEDAGLASPIVGFSQGLWRFESGSLAGEDGAFLALDAAGRLVASDSPSPSGSVLDTVRATVRGDALGLDGVPADEPEGPEAPEDQGEAGDEVPAPPEDEDEPAADPDQPVEDPEAPVERDDVAGAAPTVPADAVTRAYAVDDAGGPLLLSGRVESAAATWEALAPDVIDLSLDPGASYSFSYGEAELFGEDVLTLTLAEDGEVEARVRPEDHAALEAGLRHELGLLLGLGPRPSGVMAMAVDDPAVMPTETDLAELAAITAFAREDLDRDGRVSFRDLLELAARFGSSGLNLPADLDGDGEVGDGDLQILRQAYGFVPPGTYGPEESDAADEERAEPAD